MNIKFYSPPHVRFRRRERVPNRAPVFLIMVVWNHLPNPRKRMSLAVRRRVRSLDFPLARSDSPQSHLMTVLSLLHTVLSFRWREFGPLWMLRSA